jgi:hypothetical protein
VANDGNQEANPAESGVQILLSVVVLIQCDFFPLRATLEELGARVRPLATDYELVVIINDVGSVSEKDLRSLTAEDGLPNLQIFQLTDKVSEDQAALAGLENALGDYAIVFNPLSDSSEVLERMLKEALAGAEVVFAANTVKPKQSFRYRMGFAVFNGICRALVGVDLARGAPRLRLLSRRVVNYIFQRPNPSDAYRLIPAKAGFRKANFTYSADPKLDQRKSLREGAARALQLLMNSSTAPLRIATTIALFGASANIVYSGYVVAIALLKSHVAEGWVTLSLQQSGMFVLISFVLFLLCEYVMHLGNRQSQGSSYHVSNEFTSFVMSRRKRLNLAERKTA